MKATNRHDLVKAIAFLVSLLCIFILFSCNPQDEPQLLKPIVTIGEAENVTTSSATLVSTVIPNGDNVPVSFAYKETGSSNWITVNVITKYSGSNSYKVTFNVSGLQSGIKYDFKANAGEVTSTINTFATVTVISPVIKIGVAKDVKISTAKLTASVIPNSNNVPVSFEYQTNESAWISKPIPGNFSGNDSVKVTLDLSDLQANSVYKFRLKAGDQVSGESSFETYAVADYDGNYYHTVTIGNQTWLRENLKTTHFANGDPIPNVKDMTAWDALTTGAYCYYNNDAKIGDIYGALYNWYVAGDPRGLIVGYRTPEAQDWNTLSKNYPNRPACGYAIMEKGNAHWTGSNVYVTNSSGFTALPNGGVNSSDVSKIGLFQCLGTDATFWSIDTYGNSAVSAMIDQANCTFMFGGLYLKAEGFGIRLIKK